MDSDEVVKEVKEQLRQFVIAINHADAEAWSRFFSKDHFLTAIVGADHYTDCNDWIDLISTYFSMRKSQHLEPIKLHITALSQELALVVCEDKSEFWLKDGNHERALHIFSMLWEKEAEGWKIIHSHESWKDY